MYIPIKTKDKSTNKHKMGGRIIDNASFFSSNLNDLHICCSTALQSKIKTKIWKKNREKLDLTGRDVSSSFFTSSFWAHRRENEPEPVSIHELRLVCVSRNMRFPQNVSGQRISCSCSWRRRSLCDCWIYRLFKSCIIPGTNSEQLCLHECWVQSYVSKISSSFPSALDSSSSPVLPSLWLTERKKPPHTDTMKFEWAFH